MPHKTSFLSHFPDLRINHRTPGISINQKPSLKEEEEEDLLVETTPCTVVLVKARDLRFLLGF